MTSHHTLRNVAFLLVAHEIIWWAVMGSRFAVPYTRFPVPAFAVHYAVGIWEFFAAILPALVAGALASVCFAGRYRALWCWALSVSLFAWALAVVEPLAPDDSLLTKVVMIVLEFSPFLLVGIASALTLRVIERRRGFEAAQPDAWVERQAS